jgi:hypothetical protein
MITGYLIVRKPFFEENVFGSIKLKTLKNINYCGLHRSMWMDIEDYFSEIKIPNELFEKFKEIEKSDNDGSFLKTCDDFYLTQKLINLTPEISLKNEVIAIWNPTLTEIKGHVLERQDIHWIGYDIVILGGWSLIRHGIFENKREELQIKGNRINQFGLFDNIENLNIFLKTYESLAKRNLVDKNIFEDNINVEYIRIGIMQ